jgi:hypothetical protein
MSKVQWWIVGSALEEKHTQTLQAYSCYGGKAISRRGDTVTEKVPDTLSSSILTPEA